MSRRTNGRRPKGKSNCRNNRNLIHEVVASDSLYFLLILIISAISAISAGLNNLQKNSKTHKLINSQLKGHLKGGDVKQSIIMNTVKVTTTATIVKMGERQQSQRMTSLEIAQMYIIQDIMRNA